MMSASWMAVVAIAAAVCIVCVLALVLPNGRHGTEGFDLGGLFKKAKEGIAGGVNKGLQKMGDVLADSREAQFNATYVGRVWDGADWSCPDNTVDTGLDDARACLTSKFSGQQWRWDGAQWGWSCPNGTTATGKSGNQACEVGHMGRTLVNGAWVCPSGTTDTGANWGNADWAGAQKQCKRTGAFGGRMWNGTAWACPAWTTDTGRNWGQVNGGNQCKFVGG